MAGSAANADVWEGADVYVAPIGTTLPDDLITPLDAAFKPIGLLSDADGLLKQRSQDTKDLSAWGKGNVRSTKKNHKRMFQVTALEDNDVVFGLANPGSTSAAVGGVTTRTVKRPRTDPRAYVFELTDGDTTKRIVVPRGEVTDVGEVKLIDEDFEATQLTVTAYAADDGTFYLEVTNNAGAAPAA